MDQDLIRSTEEQMKKALEVLTTEISSIRTGKATPSLIENIVVTVYGGTTKLRVMELATVATLDASTLVITPFDASILNEIQKGIMDSGSGFNPASDGQVLRVSIPPLSEERRLELIHMMHQKLENGHIMIRQARHQAMADVKKEDLGEDDELRMEKEIQRLTDDYTHQIDTLGKKKEEELLQI